MCRWGCTTTSTTYMCKWCGTRYCKGCLRGDFTGEMLEAGKCRKCNQKRCQGQRVEYVPGQKSAEDKKGARGRSSAKSIKSAKGGKKSAKKGKKKKK